jgi:HK97 gp10 family phage protein
MQIAIELQGIKSLVKDFNNAPPVIKSEINKAINFSGVKIQREARTTAPVDTGNLRSQIRFKNTRQGQGVIGSYAQYSIYVHEGTRFQNGNPYMDRAVQISTPMVNVYFNKAVKNITSHLARGI